jgi:hypothetical protein
MPEAEFRKRVWAIHEEMWRLHPNFDLAELVRKHLGLPPPDPDSQGENSQEVCQKCVKEIANYRQLRLNTHKHTQS